MDKGVILGLPQPGKITQEDIDRVVAAVANAPTTDSGIVVPPHLLEEQPPEPPKPNRAQRRAAEKRMRKQRKIRPVKLDPELIAATERLNKSELVAAKAMTKQIAKAPEGMQEEVARGLLGDEK